MVRKGVLPSVHLYFCNSCYFFVVGFSSICFRVLPMGGGGEGLFSLYLFVYVDML